MRRWKPYGVIESAAVRILGVAAVSFYAWFIWRTSERYAGERLFTLFDDAMVSMTYARNLADGFGLVWNRGGEAVEGYTNFLWTLWMAVPHLLPLPDAKVSLFVMASGAVLLVANSALVGVLARRLDLRWPAAGLAAATATAFLYPLVFWTLRGMEVGLMALLIQLGALLVADLEGASERQESKRVLLLGGVLVAGILTRPDFLVPTGILIAGATLTAPRARRMRRLGALLLCSVGALVLLSAGRWLYYGDALPNTYYLKVAGHGIAERIQRGGDVFADVFVAQLWPFVVLALLATRHAGFWKPLPLLLVALAGGQFGYSIYVGGDSWESFGFANRFVTLGLPPLLIVAALAIDVVAGWLRVAALPPAARAPAILALGVALAWAPGNLRDFASWLESGAHNDGYDRRQAEQGLRIRARTPEDTTIAVMAAGNAVYFARRAAVDLLGKSDRTIAHSTPVMPLGVPGHTKYDLTHSLASLRPDLVVHVWLPTGEVRRYVSGLGYVEAPAELGKYATPELLARLRDPAAASAEAEDG